MATDDVQVLSEQLPSVFNLQDPPARWDDFYIVPVDIEETDAAVAEEPPDWDELEEALIEMPPREDFQVDLVEALSLQEDSDGPGETALTFPGSPQGKPGESDYRPPDAIAFYLPFHYFYPDLWGVYIVAEDMMRLRDLLRHLSKRKLSVFDSHRVARFFLYYHEAFHHNVEAFATRLEVTHRQAVYRTGVQQVFENTFGTDDCLEEALANAYAFRRTVPNFSGETAEVVRTVLKEYIEGQPEGYRRGIDLIGAEEYREARRQLSEACHDASFPLIDLDPQIWRLFGHGYRGIATINSYTNYLIPRHSRLSNRVDLHGRRIGYRDVKEKLEELVGLHLKRQGRGSHEIYETNEGGTVSLYYTTGDVPKGTLNHILKQAGVNMTVHDFLRM